MAVRVSGGETSDIKFTYHTPGIFEGAAVTSVSIILYIVYMVISAKKNKIKPLPKMKKQYKVAAFGSADELGERYKNLVLRKNPMKRKPTFKNNIDTESVDGLGDNDIVPNKITLEKVEPVVETDVNVSEENSSAEDNSTESIAENTVIAEPENTADNAAENGDNSVSENTAEENAAEASEDEVYADMIKDNDSETDEMVDGIIIGNIGRKVTDAKGKDIFKNINNEDK